MSANSKSTTETMDSTKEGILDLSTVQETAPRDVIASTHSELFDMDDGNHSDDEEDYDDDLEDGDDSSSMRYNKKGADRRRSSANAPNQIAERENKQVFYSRLLMLFVLSISASAIGYVTYWFVSEEEEDDYKVQFRNDAKELMDVSSQNGKLTLAVLQMLSTLLSSSAKSMNEEWPFFTLPDFEKFGQQSRELSGALLLAFTPLVTNGNRTGWENYSVQEQNWIKHGLDDLNVDTSTMLINPIYDFIYRKTLRSFIPELNDLEVYSPVWQMSPAPTDTSVINFNLFNHPTFKRLVEFAIYTRSSAISEVLDTSLVFGTSAPQTGDEPQSIAVLPVFQEPDNTDSPIVGHIVAVIPWGKFFAGILQDTVQSLGNANQGSQNINDPDGNNGGVYVVLEESCGNSFTYLVNGPNATFLGTDDFHDPAYDDLGVSTRFIPYEGAKDISQLEFEEGIHCEYTINVYPSLSYEQDFETNRPVIFMIGVLMVFVFTSLVFVMYDIFVQRRQQKVNTVAVQSNAIVSSLFPAQVRDKLYQNNAEKKATFNFKNKKSSAAAAAATTDIESPVDESLKVPSGGGLDPSGFPSGPGMMGEGVDDTSPPIADLFPSATVLFMDIAGFTAWSSAREPSQVFILLETIYRSFDKIAKYRRVFKVETIGDCYVAVCGLPEPNDDHAVVMARFARDCMEKMYQMTHKLEMTLGPDTTELAMRVGLHSGPVTAGVLRGDRARFQLFGDTVNTAARMESTGIKKKIQLSQETANLLVEGDKANWFKPREDIIHAKGKGEMQTYWLLPKSAVAKSSRGTKSIATASRYDASSEGEDSMNHLDPVEFMQRVGHDSDQISDGSESHSDEYSAMSASSIQQQKQDERTQRLVNYTSDVLLQILKQIVAKRKVMVQNHHQEKSKQGTQCPFVRNPDSDRKIRDLENTLGKTGICLDEVVEVIDIPRSPSASFAQQHAAQFKTVELPQSIKTQLTSYVEMVASMYRKNPFHNFDHASHVAQSTNKLLSRIVSLTRKAHQQPKHQLAQVDENSDEDNYQSSSGELSLGDCDASSPEANSSFGITCDPLTQFAIVFSSLIHDVDHRGVPNFVLVKEDPELGSTYKNKAVAEQNSMDVAWNLFMDPAFVNLREALYCNESELKRFRQLVVNSLMATDIFDAELAALRKKRWDNAFAARGDSEGKENTQISINRKATIVIEHIIQASDVAHTMQHWHVYSKWNEKLYHEMFTAYCQGRTNKDPTEGWYKGELWFFDNYVIPLAHKLKECGVFGVSSDEYLNYALANRREWEKKGKDIVAANFKKFQHELQERREQQEANSNSRRSAEFVVPLPKHH